MEMKPVGVSGVLCIFGTVISDEISRQVAAFAAAVTEAALPGVVECVPGYASLLVRYDPLATDDEALTAALDRLQASCRQKSESPSCLVELPVCYGGALGPDLPYVAQHAGLTEAEVVRLHSGRDYRIYMLGFLPGFPYLGGLDERLHTPRLATPRAKIPAGSVGIGGQQTGVYPMESPGGWQLIGRTPVPLFVPGQPLPYRAGDMIRFVPISENEYHAWEAKHHGH